MSEFSDGIGNPNPKNLYPDLDQTNVVDFGNNNRGAGPPIGDYVYADPGTVIAAGAQHAENAYALHILQGNMTIDAVPNSLRAAVQVRVDNPPPSIQAELAALDKTVGFGGDGADGVDNNDSANPNTGPDFTFDPNIPTDFSNVNVDVDSAEFKEWLANNQDFTTVSPEAIAEYLAQQAEEDGEAPTDSEDNPQVKDNDGSVFGAIGDFLKNSGIDRGIIQGVLDIARNNGGDRDIFAPNETGAVNVDTGTVAQREEIGSNPHVVEVPIIGEEEDGGGGGAISGGGGGSPSSTATSGDLGLGADIHDTTGDGTTYRPGTDNATLQGQIDAAASVETDEKTKADLEDFSETLGNAENVPPSGGIDQELAETNLAGDADDGIDINFGIDLRSWDDDDVLVPVNTELDKTVAVKKDSGSSVAESTQTYPDEEGVLPGAGVDDGEDGNGGTGTAADTGADDDPVTSVSTVGVTGDGEDDGDDGEDGEGIEVGKGEGLEPEKQNPLIEPEIPDYKVETPKFTVPGYFGWSKAAVEDQHRRNPWTYRRNV